jgi:oligopeptide/dipeptide ABC transporter ATP-binding protein
MLREGAHDVKFNLIGLLEEIQARLGVSYLFIAHDLAAIAHISQQIAVMYLGKLVEVAESLERCANPLHPYTKALFAASLPSHPDEEKKEIVLSGEVPSALNPPSGCHFHPRCLSSCRAAPSESPISSRCPQVTRSPATSISCLLSRHLFLTLKEQQAKEITIVANPQRPPRSTRHTNYP